jgi:acetyl-CoA C-acetyltransferase
VQDAFAAESVRRAQRASKEGDFAAEIAPVTLKTRKGEQVIATDETPFQLDIDKIPTLKPAFGKDGTVTAASSSSISDGAAALVMASESAAKAAGLKPIARLVSYASHAQAPEWFTTAPAPSIQKALDLAGWKVADVDLFEINEAFACVTMAAMKDLGLPHDKVNVNGGACALGHPVGATGARLITTLIHALRKRGLRRGVASQCIGGGEACAVAIELV